MSPRRSLSIQHIATLNLAVAGMGLITTMWLVVMLVQFAHPMVSGLGLLGGPDPLALFGILRESSVRVFLICSSGVRVFFALWLILAAFGLFQNRTWARSLTLFYAWSRIATALLEWSWVFFLFESSHFHSSLGRFTRWGVDLEVGGERFAFLCFLIVITYPVTMILMMPPVNHPGEKK